MNLRSFRTYLQEKGYRESSILRTVNDAKLFDQWLGKKTKKRIRTVTYKDALEYINHLRRKELSARTINHHLRSLKHFFNHLKTKRNPFQHLKVRGESTKLLTDILSQKELQELYQSYHPQTALQKRNKVLLGLFLFQGITTGETTSIKVEDVNLQEGIIRLPGNHRLNKRTLKLEAMQVLDMADYLNRTRPHLKKQFNDSRATLIVQTTPSPNNIHNSLAKFVEMLGKHYGKFNSFKQLRRSVIVNWLKTEDVRMVQYKAGHRYVSSTERYKTNNLQQLKETILKSHPLG